MITTDEIEIITALITSNNHVINKEYHELSLNNFRIQLLKDLQKPCIKFVPTIIYLPAEKKKCKNVPMRPGTTNTKRTNKYYPSDHPLFQERKDFIINQNITCGTTWALRWDYGTHYTLSSLFSWLGCPHGPERRLTVQSIIYPKGSQMALEAVEMARGMFEFFGVPFNEEKEISYIKLNVNNNI